jgi:predicted ferric reductase
VIEASERALKLQITPARPWKVRPGQYVYLTVPKAGTLSRFQRHPFMVASPILSNSIELHIWPRDGFTEKLRRCSDRYQYCNAWIEGPYGCSVDLREFGTVIMIASEMGITGHLAYLRDLVGKQDDYNTKVRDVIFIWSVEEWAETHPARKSMDELLRKDKERETEKAVFSKEQRYLNSKTTDDQKIREYPGVRPVLSGNNVS